MFEVTLGTAGIQQLGWATLDCPFNNEEGVGDAPDSYAWDGKRVQRWNVSNAPYGRCATVDIGLVRSCRAEGNLGSGSLSSEFDLQLQH